MSSGLSLFPAPSSNLPRGVPTIKRAENYSDGLQGMSLHVSSLSKPRPTVKPATNIIQHTVSSDAPIVGTVNQLSPLSSSSSQPTSTSSQQGESAPRSSGAALTQDETTTCHAAVTLQPSPIPSTPLEHELSLLHADADVEVPTTSRAPRLKQPVMPEIVTSSSANESSNAETSVNTQNQLHSHGAVCTKDQESKEGFHTPDDVIPMRSIFPQYDFNKPLSEQSYYPTPRAVPPVAQNSLSPPTSEKHMLKHFDSAVGLVDGYEHIPAASNQDCKALWEISSGEPSKLARKVQFALYQAEQQGTALAIGLSAQNIIYDLDTVLAVRRYHPSAESVTPVAQLSLPEPSQAHFAGNATTEIFPHTAAVDALAEVTKSLAAEGASNHSAYAIAQQQKVIADAHRHHACTLVRKTRSRDMFSAAVTASYTLRHPELGICPIEVTKSQVAAQRSSAEGFTSMVLEQPKAKISFHHPSATPAAIEAGTLNLAFLDFARDSCVLDLPGLAALGGKYLVDTVVSALLAVAVIENEELVEEASAMPAFDAPPRAPLPSSASRMTSKEAKRKWRKNAKKVKAKKQVEFMGEQVELPFLARGTLSVLGFGFKAAIFVLETGFKVAAGTVVGLTHVAKKL